MSFSLIGVKQCEIDLNDESASMKWEAWLGEFENFRIASNLDGNEFTVQKRVAIFLSMAGEKIRQLYTPIKDADDTLGQVIAKLTGLFAPVANREFSVYKFRNLEWYDDETVDNFVNILQMAAPGCEYGDSLDREIVQMIIKCCKSTALKRLVLNDADRSLTNVLAICRQNASIEKQMREMNASSSLKEQVHATHRS